MNERSRHSDDSGFTLVEVLVTVLILGLLAAVVFPVVIGQVDKADPTAASNDLANLRTGIELFELDVRPREPANLEQLADVITASESDADGTTYTSGDVNKWDGPYIDIPISDGTAADASIKETGFGGDISNGLRIYDATNNEINATNTDFLAIRITGLSSTDFESLNDQIDGEGESNTTSTGKLRRLNNDSTFFLAVPKK